MKPLLADLLHEATQLTRSGHLLQATQAIQRALSGLPAAAGATSSAAVSPAAAGRLPSAAAPCAQVLEGFVTEVEAPQASDLLRHAHRGAGEFIAGSHHHAALTRAYKLYVPPGAAGRCLPLVLMLHGCTQDPDDFAAGTAMNDRAREMGFFVLYPAQSPSANASRCWNWFKHNHQQRGSGEPALIADLVRTLIEAHGIDARRVYVAGLSAGAAMAAIVAAAYPEVFAAVGVHSGLPLGAAGNVSEALAAMRGGGGDGAGLHNPARGRRAAAAALTPPPQVPTIVFHGDQDTTVHPRNGEQVIGAALRAAADPAGAVAAAQVQQGASGRGRRWTRTTYPGPQGRLLAEHWLVHGAGHAWSGGQAGGSFTDVDGPDATREMLRFFFAHPQRTV